MERGGLERLCKEAGLPAPTGEPSLLRYHKGLRSVLLAHIGGRPVAVKAYRRYPRDLITLHDTLHARGLDDGSPPTIPPLLAQDLSQHLMVFGWIEGPSCRQLIGDGHAQRAAEIAAAWITTTRKLPIALERSFEPHQILLKAAIAVDKIVVVRPDLAARLSGCLELLAATRPADGPVTVCHGSMSIHHVLDLGAGPGVIDWDRCGRGPVEFDVAGFVTTLTRFKYGRPQFAAVAEATEEAFLRRLEGIVEEERLNWYRLVSGIKLLRYYSRKQPHAWRERMDRTLAELEGRAGAHAVA